MQTRGISRRDYERLPNDTKLKAITMLEAIKSELRRRGFSLRFLGHDGRWRDLTPWKFLALPEDNYRRLISGAKWIRPRPREELLEQLTELYNIVSTSPKLQDKELEYWTRQA